jgi:anti-sigma regulatory factor (Ser/Thr protein kinase)
MDKTHESCVHIVFAGQLELNGGAGDVRVARRWLGTWLVLHQVNAELIDTTTLLLSELVTNASIHAGTAICVTASITEQRLRIEVTDLDPERVPVHWPAAEDSERGRGIGIVSALAATWGTDRLVSSKTVWFEVAC